MYHKLFGTMSVPWSCYWPEKWLHNRIYCPSNRSKQIQETHTAYSTGTQYTRQSLNEKHAPLKVSQPMTVCLWSHICYFFHSNFAAYIVYRRYKPCEFLWFVWTDCWGNKSYYIITSPANLMTKVAGHSALPCLQGPEFKGSRVCVLFATRIGRRRRGVSVKHIHIIPFAVISSWGFRQSNGSYASIIIHPLVTCNVNATKHLSYGTKFEVKWHYKISYSRSQQQQKHFAF